MKLYKYNQFLNDKPLNENLDKAKKFMKERFLLFTVAKELGYITGELGEQLKHKEKLSLTMNDFTEEQQSEIRSKLKTIRLKDDDIRNIERDPDFIKIRELLKDNLGYTYMFVYFYFVEMVSFEELNSLYNKLITYKDLLDRLPKKFDINFIDPNIPNNCEVLVDGLDNLEDYRKIKKMIDKLTPELKKDYNDSPLMIKDQFSQVARSFDQVGNGDESKKIKLWKSFFGEIKDVDGKKVYFGPLRRYSNIREFIKAAQNYLKSSENEDIIAFYDKINSCNDKFGQLGADIVLDEGGILIIEVKSFQANQMLNGHTRHCIKDYMSQWENYVSSKDNKQYYIYNFNIPQYENLSTIGITIGPGSKIYACHLKDDQGFSERIKSTLNEWEKKYSINTNILRDILVPMSKEEIERRERAKIAEREIVKRGISIEQIKKYVKEDGANINKDNCVALLNAVEENDIEKAKVILELGGSPNLRSRSESIINKAQDIEMIKLLVSNGSELTGEVFNNVCNDISAVEYCLKQGLNPNFDNSLPIRRCCKGSWKSRDDLGEGYFDVFKLLLKYGASINDDSGRNMPVKWAAEYGRFEFMDFLIDHGVRDGFMNALVWLKHSRKMNDTDKDRTIKYLEEKIEKYEK